MPARVGRYEVTGLLGEGAFGRVYRGFDPKLDREVAIKVPKADALTPELRERFLREARAAAAIHHPNVCPIYDVETDGDLPYLVTRFVAGGTLAGVLERRREPYSGRDAVAIVHKIALGVAAAHARNVLHRDLKPANVLWDEAGREFLVTDFGLARVSGAVPLSRTGEILGTPAYMSPEQARGRHAEVGPLADVYSLGVILYRLVTGVLPFDGSVLEVLARAQFDEPRPPSEVCPGLDPRIDALCATAMAKQAGDRYPSATAFADALAAHMRSAATDPGITPAGLPAQVGLGVSTLDSYDPHDPDFSLPIPDRTGALPPTVEQTCSTSPERTTIPGRTASSPRRRLPLPSLLACGAALLVMSGIVVTLLVKSREPDTPAGNVEPPGPLGGDNGSAPGLRLTWLDRPVCTGTFTKHTGQINCVVFMGDGRRVMTSDRGELSGRARIWDPITMSESAVFRPPAETGLVQAVSPDASRMVCGILDQLLVCDAVTGHVYHTLPFPDSEVFGVSFHPSGTQVLIVASKDVGTWDTKTGLRILTIDCSAGRLARARFSPDGQKIVTADLAERSARVWDSATGKRLATCVGHESEVSDATFSADGAKLVTAGNDKTVRIWDAASGGQQRVLAEQTSAAFTAAFSPDGSRVAVGLSDATVRIWDAATGQSLATLTDHTNAVVDLAFKPDNTRLVTVDFDKTVRVYQVAELR